MEATTSLREMEYEIVITTKGEVTWTNMVFGDLDVALAKCRAMQHNAYRRRLPWTVSLEEVVR